MWHSNLHEDENAEDEDAECVDVEDEDGEEAEDENAEDQDAEEVDGENEDVEDAKDEDAEDDHKLMWIAAGDALNQEVDCEATRGPRRPHRRSSSGMAEKCHES
jgi:hypothetical protein